MQQPMQLVWPGGLLAELQTVRLLCMENLYHPRRAVLIVLKWYWACAKTGICNRAQRNSAGYSLAGFLAVAQNVY